MKVKLDIHELSNRLSEEFYEDLQIEKMDVDTERISRLALEKLHAENGIQAKEETKMKKTPKRLFAAIVAVVALTTTAYAASKTEFFKEIFGFSASEADIQEVGVYTEDKNFKMTAEQLISDGFNTKIIVSLEGKSEAAAAWLSDSDLSVEFSTISENTNMNAMLMEATEELSQFQTEGKFYYCVTYSSNQDYSGEPITVTLKQIGEAGNPGAEEFAVIQPMLSLVIENPESIDRQKMITFEEPENAETTYPVSITVNAISAVLVIQENDVENTPTMDVVLVMKDGSKEQIFEGGWITEGGGGGGVAIADSPAEQPLASGYSYRRDLDTNRIIETSAFSRILNPEEADYLLIDGERFDF